ncbi:MAG: hypothetical protein H7831_14490 [Magnetococcus sp. WYHC-3]
MSQQEEDLQRRKEAEDYIMSSGDPEAIKMLMLARATSEKLPHKQQGGFRGIGCIIVLLILLLLKRWSGESRSYFMDSGLATQ